MIMSGAGGCLSTHTWLSRFRYATLTLMVKILNWNGKDLPGELRDLPAGRYVLESIDEVPELTQAEDEGLHRALASLRAGKGRNIDQVRQSVAAVLKK